MVHQRSGSMLALSLLLGVVLAATLASSAQATPPTRSTEPPFTFDNNTLFCGFPMRAEVLKDNVKILTFSSGRQLVTGTQTYRLTNLATGKSLVVKDAGNLITNPDQTTDTFHGRLVLFLFPIEPFGPSASLFVGSVHATFAQPGGFFYSGLRYTGKRVDLCAALSG
jgi:hypothetical protein